MHKGVKTRWHDLLAYILEIGVLGVSEALNKYPDFVFLVIFPLTQLKANVGTMTLLSHTLSTKFYK